MPVFFLLCATLFSLPAVLHAEVVISEIMYDLEGIDAGREWIEVHNLGENALDISTWRFFEGETNHKLTLVGDGSGSISALGYAVIADDAALFLADWPAFHGVLFESAFSLSNSGETIGLRDSDLLERDLVSYESGWGGAGSGASLQRSGSGWISALPTPGAKNAEAVASLGSGEATGAESEPAAPEGGGGSGTSESGVRRDFPIEPQIFAYAGEDRTVAVGADTVFEGKATGLVGKPLPSAWYIWNFGDGETKEGRSVFHYYKYPGTYLVTLDVSSGEYAASDRVVVVARHADIAVSFASPERILITNNDTDTLDLSWWFLESDGMRFMFPRNTVLLRGGVLILPSETTGLASATKENTSLLYPNGILAYAYEPDPSPPSAPSAKSGSATSDGASGTEKKRAEEDTFSHTPSSFAKITPKSVVGTQVFVEDDADAPLGAAVSLVSPHLGGSERGGNENARFSSWGLALLGLLLLGILALFGFRKSRLTPEPIELVD